MNKLLVPQPRPQTISWTLWVPLAVSTVSHWAPDLGSSSSILSSATAQGSRSDPDPSESLQPWLLPPIRAARQRPVWVQAGTLRGRNCPGYIPWSQHHLQACRNLSRRRCGTSVLHLFLLLSPFRWCWPHSPGNQGTRFVLSEARQVPQLLSSTSFRTGIGSCLVL